MESNIQNNAPTVSVKQSKGLQKIQETVEFRKFAVGARSLSYQGDDLISKLTKNLSVPVTIESAPILFTGADGHTYDTRKYKAGFRNNILTGIMSRRYTFIANEKAYELITEAGFRPEKVEFGAGGNSMFVQVFSDSTEGTRPHTFTAKSGDSVEVGVMIRNSIDGKTSFGGDIFTFRSRCSNGSIIGKKSLGSFSVKHVGNYERLIATFRSQLNRAFYLSAKVKTYYQKATEIKVNMEIAQALLDTKIPAKYLPDFMTIEKKQLILHDKNATVWEAFNGVTEKAWHGTHGADKKDLDITSRSQYTQKANSWLFNVTAPLVVA